MAQQYPYLCNCTTETIDRAAAEKTGGFYGCMRFWLLEPDTRPFVCPDCQERFIPCPPDDPEMDDIPRRQPLRFQR